jgi:tetratricopeptide (TPR) repeat protein
VAGTDDRDRTETLRPAADNDTVVAKPGTRVPTAPWRELLVKGAHLGRYVVEEVIGEGGMGVVYAAFDPELHRRVALKLVQPEMRNASTTEGRARLLREAQAIAQLSHPNVIHVYDVGTYEDQVFLALEFVDGEHLAKWTWRTKPPWREIVRVFIAAGRGLAAAHAAGLVHRDFKPDNVLRGKDGRVLVMDFGIARVDGVPEEEPPTPRSSQPLLAPLTEIGVVMGTPGYAAPEQLGGAPGDARADQFSFAAALYACLYRKRPYEAKTFAAYRTMLGAAPPAAPANTDVPAWVQRVIDRGLSLDPAARFPSMDAMLAALAADPALRRRKWLIAGGVAAALGVAAFATVHAMTTSNHAQLCAGAERELAGVWDDARRAAMQKAFVASGRPYAQRTFERAAKRLDEQSHAWVAMDIESCQATRVRGDQPEAVMTVRRGCLDQRLRELGKLVDVFVAADAKVVDSAVGATSALLPLEPCADVKALLAAVPPPRDPAIRATVGQLRDTLARAKALLDGGKYADAATVAEPVIAAAKALGYRPIEAEALVRLGEIQVWLQDGERAAGTLRAAARAGEAGHDDEIRARALAWLVGVVGFNLEKPPEALALADDARAALERLGGDPYVESILEGSLGRTYSRTTDYAKMLEHHEKSLVLRRKLFGEDDPNTASGYNNVAAAFTQLGRYRDSLLMHRKAQGIREKVLGPDHPDTAMSDINVGGAEYELGELDAALRDTNMGLGAAMPSLPPTHMTILIGELNRAAIEAELGRYADAQVTYDALFATLRAKQPHSQRMIRALSDHANVVLARTGHAKAALAEAEQAIAIASEGGGTPDDDVAFAMQAKGYALEMLGQLDAALAVYRQAIDIDEKVLGHDDPKILDLVAGVGTVALAQHRPADAAAAFEHALAIAKAHDIGGKWRARLEFELARAVAKSDPARARTLATSARGWYAGSPLAKDLAAIDALLATLGSAPRR